MKGVSLNNKGRVHLQGPTYHNGSCLVLLQLAPKALAHWVSINPTEFFFFFLTPALYFLFKKPTFSASHKLNIIFFSGKQVSCMPWTTYKAKHKRRSLCEISMDLIVNIIRVSSVSVASKSTSRKPAWLQLPAKRSRAPAVTANMLSMPHQLPASQILQDPESGSKSNSYLIEMERKRPAEIESVDDRASDYIRGFHTKNRHDCRTVSEQLSYILPPPPPFYK